LPDSLTHVIVMGHEMNKTLVDTYSSALAGAATGRE
jgi:epoxyqueuosine reductase